MSTLVTGANGLVGRKVVERLSGPVLASVRDPKSFEYLGPDVEVVRANLQFDRPWPDLDRGSIDTIVHCAANTSFTMSAHEAWECNVESTRRVIEFAREAPHLTRLVFISTLYVGGRTTGLIAEEAIPAPPAFANNYEWSKSESERLILESGLPNAIVRVPTIIGAADGSVSQYNAFHNTLRLFFYGLISVMPGCADTPVHVTDVDSVAEIVARVVSDELSGFFHATPPSESTVNLRTVIDVAFEIFGADRSFRRRRLLVPELVDRKTFELVLDAASKMTNGPLPDALGSIAPFAQQLYHPKDFTTVRADALVGRCSRPEPRRLVADVCRDLVATRWGRRPFEEGESDVAAE